MTCRIHDGLLLPGWGVADIAEELELYGSSADLGLAPWFFWRAFRVPVWRIRPPQVMTATLVGLVSSEIWQEWLAAASSSWLLS